MKPIKSVRKYIFSLSQEGNTFRFHLAVIYIGYGQEDKSSIFNNSHGSQNYEEFLTHLGWKVDLSKHTGFRGGLHQLANTYSIYYANELVEIMFHVATMIDGSTDEDRLRKKTRHIGNDEVQIIWTEHYHEYDRSIIASAFGDVLIVIHPLPNGLFRIKIDKTSQVMSSESDDEMIILFFRCFSDNELWTIIRWRYCG